MMKPENNDLLIWAWLLVIFAFLLGSMTAQSYGTLSISPIAPTVAGCGSGRAKTVVLCPVGSGTAFQMYVSYNAGPFQAWH